MNLFKQALIACAAGTMMFSCTDAPEYPVGELYQEAFIKQFGKIPADREWNLAQQMSVTVTPNGLAHTVQVYVQCGEKYYRVALFCEVEGETTIPFDAPAGTTNVLVEIDGLYYLTTPNSSIRPNPNPASASRAESDFNPQGKVLKVVKNSTASQQWEPQLYIQTTQDLTSNTTYVFSGDIYATDDRTLKVQIQDNDNSKWSDQQDLAVAANVWKHFEVEISGNDGPYKELVLQLGIERQEGETKIYENTYYFDNLNLVQKDQTTSLINSNRDGSFTNESNASNWVRNFGDNNTYGSAELVDVSTIGGGTSGNTSSNSSEINTDGSPHPEKNVLKFEKTSNDNDIWKPQLLFLPNEGIEGEKAYVFEFDIYSTVQKDIKVEVASLSGSRTINADTWTHVKYIFLFGNSNNSDPVKLQIGGNGSFTEYIDNIAFYERDNTAVSKMPSGVDGTFETLSTSDITVNDWYWDKNDADVFTVTNEFPGSTGSGGGDTPNTPGTPTFVDPLTSPINLGGDLAWLVCAEDLGATDDIDFNDVIIRLEYLSTNLTLTSNNWNVVENEYKLNLGEYDPLPSSASQRGSRAGGQEFVTLSRADSNEGKIQFLSGGVKITAMAAGGTLPSWLHYYNSDTKIDYVIGSADVLNTANTWSAEAYEWHTWFSTTPHIGEYFEGYTCEDGSHTTTHIMMNTDTEYNCKGSFIKAVALGNTDNKDYKTPHAKKANFGHVVGVLPAEVMGENFTMSEFVSNVKVSGDYKRAKIVGGFYLSVGDMVSSTSGGSSMNDNTVLLTGDYNIIGLSEMGKAPQMFMIPDIGSDGKGWAWPSERADIRLVYSVFKEWVSSGNVIWHLQAPTSIKYRDPQHYMGGDADFHGNTGYVNRSLFETR